VNVALNRSSQLILTRAHLVKDAGVHQNMTFPVHPDPIQECTVGTRPVRVRAADADDKPGDIFVDTEKSRAVYKKWLAMTKTGG